METERKGGNKIGVVVMGLVAVTGAYMIYQIIRWIRK